MKSLCALLAILIACSSLASAQTTPKPLPSDPAAERAADDAARAWLAGSYKAAPADILRAKTLDEQAEALRKVLLFTQPQKNSSVSFKLREATTATGSRRVYHYPLSDAGEDATLVVTLERMNGAWVARGVRDAPNVKTIPEGIFTPLGGWFFVALTALLAWAVLAKTVWRRWMLESLAVARTFRGVVLGTMGALFGLFVLGALAGAASPKLVEVIQEFAVSALANTGLKLDAGVPSTAFGIAFNNTRNGLLIGSFVPGSLFAVLAYLLFAFQSLFYGFVLTPAGSPLLAWLLHLPVILIELGAYFFVVGQSGVMLFRVIKGTSFRAAWLDYAKCLTVGVSVLVLIAWYEAFEVLVLVPALIR